MTTDSQLLNGQPSTEAGIPEDPRVIEVVQDYLAELERGGHPDRAQYARRYPELASAVLQCLEGLDLVHEGLGTPLDQQALPPPALHAIGERLQNPLGDFQIVRELARGGMGVVYEAIQLSLGRPVALKVLPFASTLDSRQLQRFKNEAQAAALLHHTNIVPIYAVGCERGVHFYAMQLIDGRSLAEVIRQLRDRGEPLTGHDLASTQVDPATVAAQRATITISEAITAGGSLDGETFYRRAAQLMVQAADALEHAHQQGVVHRDIKPGNLLVNAQGNLWIADFGLAQFQADTTGITRSGDLLGTLRYMSPEQTMGQRALLDHRTDIYSLGATFYELLTLEPVFSADNRQSLLYQVLHQEPRPPRSLRKSIPIELETIVLKTMNKNPADRYGSAAELAADIRRYLNHQPIKARRASLVDRVRKWARRHPSLVAAGVLIWGVVAIASLVSNWLISREQQRTEQARQSEQLRAEQAEQRFRQARDAVDILIKVSEDELADKPFLLATRRRLLQIVLSYYQDFYEQRRGDDRSLAELAQVQEHVKEILYELDVLHREHQIGLLGVASVQVDLELTEPQKAAVERQLKQWTEERTAAFHDTLAKPEDVRRRQFVAIAQRHYDALNALLSPAQIARLNQVALQMQGVFAFKESEVAERLQLSAEQLAFIREVERQALVRLPPPGEASGGRWRPYLSREEAVAKILEILRPEQQARWQELTGRPYRGLDEARPPRPPDPPPRKSDA